MSFSWVSCAAYVSSGLATADGDGDGAGAFEEAEGADEDDDDDSGGTAQGLLAPPAPPPPPPKPPSNAEKSRPPAGGAAGWMGGCSAGCDLIRFGRQRAEHKKRKQTSDARETVGGERMGLIKLRGERNYSSIFRLQKINHKSVCCMPNKYAYNTILRTIQHVCVCSDE